MNSSEGCRWEAVFSFSSPFLEKSMKTKIEGIVFEIEFDTEKVEEGTIFKGFSIFTPILTRKKASDFVRKKANRIFDYISAIHNYSIEGYLSHMVEVKPEGELKTVYKEFQVDAILHKPEALDFNEDSFKSILLNNDEKLVRQLAHFRRGLKTEDVITKIREFYLICEDEYPKKHHFLEEYKYVRHLLSHAEMIFNNSIIKAKNLLGKKYMDPSDPRDMKAIKGDSKIIESEARKIINSKI